MHKQAGAERDPSLSLASGDERVTPASGMAGGPRDSSFGRYLEEFREGDVYRHWPGKTITESDNNLFSLLTMNHHPLHLDANFAAASQHGQTLVVPRFVPQASR